MSNTENSQEGQTSPNLYVATSLGLVLFSSLWKSYGFEARNFNIIRFNEVMSFKFYSTDSWANYKWFQNTSHSKKKKIVKLSYSTQYALIWEEMLVKKFSDPSDEK